MSADDFVFSTLIAHHPDPATASRALELAEAAVLRRAADAISALPQDYECDPGRGDAVERLRRTAAGIEEKSSRSAAIATPTDAQRRARLLHEIALGGRWKSGGVVRWYRVNGFNLGVRAARFDLAVLRDSGDLIEHHEKGVRFFTFNARKDGRS